MLVLIHSNSHQKLSHLLLGCHFLSFLPACYAASSKQPSKLHIEPSNYAYIGMMQAVLVVPEQITGSGTSWEHVLASSSWDLLCTSEIQK
jgi:hypothetical protein